MGQIVGLDIGSSAVRAAELSFGAEIPTLVTYGQVGLPPGVMVDGEVRDPLAVSGALIRLWENGEFGSKSVIVGLAGLRAITREIDLPFVPDSEIESAVRFQSEEVIPFPPDKTILSTQILADFTNADGAPMRRVLVAAAHRELVDGIVDVVERAGLQLEGVDLISSALVRALTDPTQPSEQPEAIVSVGAGLTVVVVHQGGRPQFIRTIGTGGNNATHAIASSLDLPLADAESIKRRLGEQIPQIQAAEAVVQESIEELVGEIRNSIQYFASLPGRAPISRVLVTGGGSRLRGFAENLQSEVRFPVQAVSPMARLDLSQLDLRPEDVASIDPVLAAPIGLALPEPDPAVRKFNLVPPEVIQKAFVRKISKVSILAAAAVVLILAGFSGYSFYQVRQADSSTAALTNQVASLTNEIPQFSPDVRAAAAAKTAASDLTSITSGAVDWDAVVLALAAQTPANTVVSGFTGTTTAATTGGIGTVSVSLEENSTTDIHFNPVSSWLYSIEASPLFTQPSSPTATDSCSSPSSCTVSFPSTDILTPQASLAAKGDF